MATGRPVDRIVTRNRSSSETRRQGVVDLAAALFDANGYHRTSMAEIAEGAGLRKPSLYHYFSSKDEILYRIHEGFIDQLIAKHEERLGAPMPPTEILLELMHDMLEVTAARRGHVRVSFEHFRELPEDRREVIREKRARYQSFVEGAVRAGIERGDFRPVDPRLATLALFGMCNWAYQWFRPDGSLRAGEIADFLWDIFMRGVRAVPDA